MVRNQAFIELSESPERHGSRMEQGMEQDGMALKD